jgi:hypothetical protein
MTKQERLDQLKEEEQLAKHLMKGFDRGWREWVRSIYKENDASNLRLFKVLSKVKGDDFVSDLISLMGKHNKHAKLWLTKNPNGILLNDSRFKTISQLMIEKHPSGSYRDGKVYIQVDDKRWVGFVF